MLFALVSGRQIVVGDGRVPELFCGPSGAFECGLPFHAADEFTPNGKQFSELRQGQKDADWKRVYDDQTAVLQASVRWYNWDATPSRIHFQNTDNT